MTMITRQIYYMFSILQPNILYSLLVHLSLHNTYIHTLKTTLNVCMYCACALITALCNLPFTTQAKSEIPRAVTILVAHLYQASNDNVSLLACVIMYLILFYV